jgi:GNAT superfamily N-acetyltransferase
MTMLTDADLYRRGAATLVASWNEYAREAATGELVRAPGVAVAVFPCEPERSVYNNALLECDLDALERADAVDAMEAAYRQAGITRFAAWVRERDGTMRDHLERRGYTIGESSRAMGMSLDEIRLARPEPVVAPADWSEHLRVGELPPGLLSAGDHAAFHVLVARLDGESVATAMAFDLGTDCGIFNVGTLERARRRGLGTALTVALLYDAIDRGCRTASLQSTPMAARVYAAVGFRDLGRMMEYARPDSATVWSG